MRKRIQVWGSFGNGLWCGLQMGLCVEVGEGGVDLRMLVYEGGGIVDLVMHDNVEIFLA